jgi:hypothetical protein
VALARQLEGTRFSMSATCFGSQVEPPRRCLRVRPLELGCDSTRMAAALTSAIMGSTRSVRASALAFNVTAQVPVKSSIFGLPRRSTTRPVRLTQGLLEAFFA